MVDEPSKQDVYNQQNNQPQYPSISESEAVSTLTKSQLNLLCFVRTLLSCMVEKKQGYKMREFILVAQLIKFSNILH